MKLQQVPHVAILGALLLLSASAHASIADKPAAASMAGDGRPAASSSPKPAKADESKMDVPAPPMLLLFAMGTIGVIWGRRLTANAKAKTKKT